MSDKKREITDWERAECMALKAAVDAFNAGRSRKDSLTQGRIADKLEISQGSVSSYLNGYNALNARVASVIAAMIGVPVERFSPRLAKEIMEMAQAVQPSATGRIASPAEQAELLAMVASPRSRDILARIAKAAQDGLLTEDDLNLLDQIATRFEGANKTPKPHDMTSRKRLRDKLKNNDRDIEK